MMAGMPHVIRGSAGSSLLCYLLGITNFDPIKENIVLSRFTHKHRHDMPDIDIDVPWFKHKETFQKIYKKWEIERREFQIIICTLINQL